MEIHGVGYRVALKGKDLEFALGFSTRCRSRLLKASPSSRVAHPVLGVRHRQAEGRADLGQHPSSPSSGPYKGKGVRYEGEQIRRKVGKTGK